MNRKRHRKCVLAKGYAIVEEVEYSRYCFPKMHFYDFMGVYLGELGQQKTRHLYNEMKRTFYGNNGVCDLNDRYIVELNEPHNKFRFDVEAGLIVLIDTSQKNHKERIQIVIDRENPNPLIRAIDLLA